MNNNSFEISTELSKLFQKKFDGKDFLNSQTISNNHASDKFQLFEVLVSETINLIYNDYVWHTSPIQGDGGVDFYGEKAARELPFDWKNPSLIIYGQVKFRSKVFRKDEIDKATQNIISYHRNNTIQKKSIFEIIHVIRSAKLVDISYAEYVEISNIDSRHYTIHIINADDFIKLWSLNIEFFKKLLPNSISNNESTLIIDFLKNTRFCLPQILQTEFFLNSEPSVYRCFNCHFEILNKTQIPLEIKIKLIPENNSYVNLVEPTQLLSPQGLKVRVLNKFSLPLGFLPLKNGNISLGALQVYDSYNNLLAEKKLGSVIVNNKFNPSYFSVPNNKINNDLRKALFNSESIILYSFTGEGGIGKSTLIKDVMVFSVNHGYRTIEIEHTCNLINDVCFLNELFLSIIEQDEHLLSSINEKINSVKMFFGAYFDPEWDLQLKLFFEGKESTNLAALIDCWLTALLLATDQQPLFIHLSNLHWSSPELIAFISSLIKITKTKKSLFNNKLIIVFEGRTSELICVDSKKIVPYEWNSFVKGNLIQNVRLKNWSSKDSRIYVESFFDFDETNIQNQFKKTIIKEIIKNSSGNPMHINEVINHLISLNCLSYDNTGKLSVQNPKVDYSISETLMDVVNLRINYFVKKYNDVIDCLIIYLNVEDCDLASVSNALYQILKEQYDIKNLFDEMGFVKIYNNRLLFSHEHYRNAIKEHSIGNNQNLSALLNYLNEQNISLSQVTACRLELMKINPDFKSVAVGLVEALGKEDNIHKKYSLLLLLNKIPDDILNTVGFPKYQLLYNLQQACTTLGDWNNAIDYIEQIKELNLLADDFILIKAKAQLALSNIYGIKLHFYNAIEEAETSIKDFERYLEINSKYFCEQKKFLFYRTLSLLYNRLAIEYYMSGQRAKAEIIDTKALKISQRNKDDYTKNHIKYEKGVRLLHDEPQKAKLKIQEAKSNIILPNNFLDRHEMDLIKADLLMARLVCAKLDNNKVIKNIYSDSYKLSNEISTNQEPFESILLHSILGVCCVLKEEYDFALKNFFIAATIAEKSSLESLLWKSYLNIAQLYYLLSTNKDTYKNSAVFYALESKHIIEQGIFQNPQLKSNMESIFELPKSIANSIINCKNFNPTEKARKECALHVFYKGCYFFLLD